MKLLACGINHKTAPLDIREKVVFLPEKIQGPLRNFTQTTTIGEVAILSTCNRTEIYCHPAQESGVIINWLAQQQNLNVKDLLPYVYSHHSGEAIKHLLRVSTGIDSMMLGEPQIFGQMKKAFQMAQTAGTIGQPLNQLFQYVFSSTKQIRNQTAIGAQAISIAYAAINLTKHIFSDFKKLKALLIGSGEMIELSARYLHKNNISHMVFANRTPHKVQLLANHYHAKIIPIQEIADDLADFDIVVSATASPLPILGKGLVERVLKQRKHRPIMMLDLAVPRDIEPEIAELPDVYLYNIDSLQQIVDSNLQHRQDAAKEAEKLIELQADYFLDWLHSQNAVTTIRAYRSRIEKIRDAELEKAYGQINRGESPQLILSRFAHTLTNKYLHQPSTKIRQAAIKGQYEVIDAAIQLFELEET